MKPLSTNLVSNGFKTIVTITLVALYFASLYSCDDVNKNDANDNVDPFFLEGKSFDIEFIIKRPTSKDMFAPVHVREIHSWMTGNKRSRLDVTEKTEPTTSQQFYCNHELQDICIVHSETSNTCDSTTSAAIMESIFPESSKLLDLVKELDSNNDDNHVTGPTKVFFTIARHGKEVSTAETIFHNVKAIRKTIRLKSTTVDISASLTYRFEESAPNYLKSRMPMSIAFNFAGQFTVVIFNIVQFKLNEYDHFGSPSNVDQATGDVVSFHGELAWPLASGCSEAIVDTQRTKILNSDSSSSLRLTMTMIGANSLHSSGGDEPAMLKNFIAFDGLTSNLRIDSQILGQLSATSTVIYRIRANRKYVTTHFGRVSDTNQGFVNKQISQIFKRDGCVVTQLQPDQPEKSSTKSTPRRVNLSEILLGADYFAPMGKARLRSIDTTVYESYSSRPPLWFDDSPVVDSSSSSDTPSDRRNSNYAIVVYVADSIGEFARLVHINVFKVTHLPDEPAPILLASMQVHELSWALTQSPEGEEPHRLFELHEHCSDPSAGQDLARVEMQLEQRLTGKHHNDDAAKSYQWLANPTERNLALISSLSELLGSDSALMYGVESQYAQRMDAGLLTVSFRLATHPKWMLDIKFESMANTNLASNDIYKDNNDIDISSGLIKAASLEECIWHANRLRLDAFKDGFVLLAYSQGDCYLELHKSPPEADSEGLETYLFDFKQEGRVAVYRVKLLSDPVATEANSIISKSRLRKLQNKSLVLQKLGPTDDTYAATMEVRVAKLQVQNLIANGAESKLDPSAIETRTATQLALTSQISAYSFLASPELIQSSMLKQIKLDTTKGRMTLAHCQAACDSDAACESYSYCERWPDFGCLTSELDLFQPEVIEQLPQVDKSNRAILSIQVQIKSQSGSTTSLHLTRDPRCDIYKKNYLHYFGQGHQARVRTLDKLDVYATSWGKAQCARDCFRRSLKMIQLSVDLSSRIHNAHATPAADSASGSKVDLDSLELKKIRSEHNTIIERLCHSFQYADAAGLTEAQLTVLQDNVKARDDKQPATNISDSRVGYCLLRTESLVKEVTDDGWSLSDFVQPKLLSSEAQFVPESFDFDFETLYTAQDGISLAKSEISSEAKDAYNNARFGKSISGDDHDLVAKLLHNGTNFQVVTRTGKCAQYCFLQMASPWPACRSFDVLLDQSSGVQLCQMNTASLEHVSPADLVHQSRSTAPGVGSFSMQHFEPRFGLISLELEQSLELALDSSSVGAGLKSAAGWTLLLVAMLALTLPLGLVLGAFSYSKLNSSRLSDDNRRPTLSNLEILHEIELGV